MRRALVVVGALAVAATSVSAFATEDPIFTRKKLMDANGAAAGASAAMLKGETPFSAAVAKSALQTMNAVAYAYGDYFPAGSDSGDTKASPKIWEDAEGFAAALKKFEADTDAAVAAKPEDLESFKAAFGQVAANCKSCHESFKLSN